MAISIGDGFGVQEGLGIVISAKLRLLGRLESGDRLPRGIPVQAIGDEE